MDLLEKLKLSPNMVTEFQEDYLDEMAAKITALVTSDKTSRSQWTEENDKWHKIAAQVLEKKSTPWNNASNVKYPLLTLTSVHFQARTSADLLRGPDIVRTRVIGRNRTDEEKQRGQRVSYALSYQLQEEMPNWLEDMEQGLMVLPLEGMFFKKVYFNPTLGTPVSQLVFAKDLIYNYYAKDFNRARKTHLLWKYPNEIEELIGLGYYADYDYQVGGYSSAFSDVTYDSDDEEAPRPFLECHCWWDLDNDGLKEPWVITIDEAAQKVVRITPRFRVSDVVLAQDGKSIRHIPATEFFVQYGCMPSFDNTTYYTGFGSLLGPVNAAVNSVLNQLIDAGSLANLPSGFISRGLRVRKGEEGFAPGQWKTTMSNSNDPISKHIFPIPTKEPSAVLFNLLGLLIQSGKEIGGLSDSILGNTPGQNTPHKTSAMALQQGLKMYSGVFKRVHAAMKRELQLIALLDRDYLDNEVYNDILNEEEFYEVAEDFNFDTISVIPTAEPNAITEQQKLEKAGRLAELMANGFRMNSQAVLLRILEAEGHDNIPELMDIPPPAPDPEIELKKQELELKKMVAMGDLQLRAETQKNEAEKDKAQAMLAMAKAQEIQDNTAIKAAELDIKRADQQMKDAESVRQASITEMDQVFKVAELEENKAKRENDYDVQRRTIDAQKQSSGGSE